MHGVRMLLESSSNGDRWYLIAGDEPGIASVLHEANQASGGAGALMSIRDFLSRDPGAPQTDALLKIINKLVLKGLSDTPSACDKLLAGFRNASEADASVALGGAKVQLPLTTEYEALEFFNCLLDCLTDQRTADEFAQSKRIPAGFGSTH